MRKIMFSLFVLSSMLLFSQAYATDYYVRPTGSTYGTGNGTSYANAWSGLSSINWTTVDNGNGTLWVDGVHNEAMTVSQDGEAGTTIIIKAYSSGAELRRTVLNGRSYITIDGLLITDGTTSAGILFNTAHNIVLKNCIVQNQYADGISSYDSPNASTDILIDNCIVRNNGKQVGISNGIFFKGVNIIIRNCTIYGNGYNDMQTDKSHGIYLDAGGTSADIYNNVIYSNPRGYGLQTKSGANIYGNKIYRNLRGGMNVGQNTGNIVTNIHNNLFYNNGDQAVLIFAIGYTSTINIYNNSTYKNNVAGSGSWYGELYVGSSITTLNIKNNIFYANTNNYTVSFEAAQSGMIADNNLQYGPSGNPIYYIGSRTWSYWTSTLGCDANGYNADPKYNNPPSDMNLQSDSPGIGIGAGAYASGGGSPPPLILMPPTIQGVF